MSQITVQLKWRDLNIAYNIDQKSVGELAEQYGISWQDMKSALRSYGFKIRKGEIKPADAPKPYVVHLVDEDKVVADDEEIKTPTSTNTNTGATATATQNQQ